MSLVDVVVYRSMYCRHKPLQALPVLPADVLSLYVGERGEKTEHHLKSLRQVNFSGLTELRELRLIKCQLESVEAGAFMDLGQLNRCVCVWRRGSLRTWASYTSVCV